MQPLKITVSSTRAVCSERPDPITTGMVGLRAEFTFSEDWDGLQKTAVCAGSGVAKDVLVIQDAITVPPECLTDPASELKIGLYGTNSTGNIVIPTVYAYCGRLFRGADPSGDTSTDYTLPIWAQLQAMIGDLSNLTTTAKENLVAAINEAAKSGGGAGGTAADVRMQVADGYIQYSTDGGTTWRNLIAVAELIGAPGKSAYDYAEEAGYTGTETEFAARLAAEIPTVDSTLTQSGQAADAAVVGNRLSALSEEIVNLPSGGSGLTAAQISALDGMFKVTAFSTDPVSAYAAFKEAFGIKESEGEGVPATAIVLDKTALSFADITTQTITANVTPSNSTDPVVWSTSDPAIATVSGGVVTPVADGSCTITATAGSVSASCEVTVSISAAPPASGVEWEIGGINPQGTLNTNAARLRTTGLIPREYDSVSANDGYEIIVCCFAEDGTNATGYVYFNPNDNTVGSTGVYSSGPIDLAGIKAGTIGFTSTYSWFKILLRRTDGANMAVEEGENAVVFA